MVLSNVDRQLANTIQLLQGTKKKVKTVMDSLKDKINLNTYVNSSFSLRYFI